MALVRPLADQGVRWLSRTSVTPHQVVLSHCLIGLGAAFLLAQPGRGELVGAALLLQLKTLLDNIDGGLARATGRVTETGRYLDTTLDFVVNIALFVALAQHGSTLLAAASFLILTLVLSYDFNAERLYRRAHHLEQAAPGGSGKEAPESVLRLLRVVYRGFFAPQDELLGRLDASLLRLAAGAGADVEGARERWADRFSTAALVNLGLSTQLLLLGVCAAFGRPYLFVYLVLLQLPYLAAVQLVRVVRFRTHGVSP